jgi:AraC-like DNA-binding protein
MLVVESYPTVATVVDPRDRPRLDAAAAGRFRTIHAESVADVIRAVRERPVQAVLVSPNHVPHDQVPWVAALVRSYPGVQTVAVVSRHDTDSAERLLAFGASGIRTLLDLSQREGWSALRDALCHPTSPTAAAILGRVMPELDEAPADCRLCFETLIRVAPGTPTVRDLCRRYGLRAPSFVSRFFRARLPSPKRYLTSLRLVYVAAMFEVRGLSVADAAYQLDYSSPQSFGRHLKAATGLTPREFRRTMPFPRALEQFHHQMIVPYRAALRAFRPLEPQGPAAPGPAVTGRAVGNGRVSP